MQNMGAFPGKSDCLVLPKNLALCRKPEEKHYEFGHQVAKTLWRSRACSNFQLSSLVLPSDASCTMSSKVIDLLVNLVLQLHFIGQQLIIDFEEWLCQLSYWFALWVFLVKAGIIFLSASISLCTTHTMSSTTMQLQKQVAQLRTEASIGRVRLTVSLKE